MHCVLIESQPLESLGQDVFGALDAGMANEFG